METDVVVCMLTGPAISRFSIAMMCFSTLFDDGEIVSPSQGFVFTPVWDLLLALA